jgi:hypothetical protein
MSIERIAEPVPSEAESVSAKRGDFFFALFLTMTRLRSFQPLGMTFGNSSLVQNQKNRFARFDSCQNMIFFELVEKFFLS